MGKKTKQKTIPVAQRQKIYEGDYFVSARNKDEALKEAVKDQRKTSNVALAVPKKSSYKAIIKAYLVERHPEMSGTTRITPRRPKLR